MHREMQDADTFHPGISMHHIPVGTGLPGLLFVLATLFIFGIGIPAFLVLLVISGILGIFAARIMLYWRRHHALDMQILNLHKYNR